MCWIGKAMVSKGISLKSCSLISKHMNQTLSHCFLESLARPGCQGRRTSSCLHWPRNQKECPERTYGLRELREAGLLRPTHSRRPIQERKEADRGIKPGGRSLAELPFCFPTRNSLLTQPIHWEDILSDRK
jgi:hypothetical protein